MAAILIKICYFARMAWPFGSAPANAIRVKPKPPEECQNYLVDDFGPAW